MNHQCPACSFEADNLADMFAHLASKQHADALAHHHKHAPELICDALGFNYRGGFPTASGNFNVAGLDVEIKPKAQRTQDPAPHWNRGVVRSAVHRIYVTCPTCHKKIPAGRIHQHLIVHRSRNVICKHCDKAYGTGNHLRAHMRVAHFGGKYA